MKWYRIDRHRGVPVLEIPTYASGHYFLIVVLGAAGEIKETAGKAADGQLARLMCTGNGPKNGVGAENRECSAAMVVVWL